MTVTTELAKLAGALVLLAAAFGLFHPWPAGPVSKGDPLLAGDCSAWKKTCTRSGHERAGITGGLMLRPLRRLLTIAMILQAAGMS